MSCLDVLEKVLTSQALIVVRVVVTLRRVIARASSPGIRKNSGLENCEICSSIDSKQLDLH